MTKTISVRVENETHAKLVNMCSVLGQTMNEMLKEQISVLIPRLDEIKKEKLPKKSNENGLNQTEKPKEEPKATMEILLDSEIKDPSKLIHMRYNGNGEYIQEGVPESKAMRMRDIPDNEPTELTNLTVVNT